MLSSTDLEKIKRRLVKIRRVLEVKLDVASLINATSVAASLMQEAQFMCSQARWHMTSDEIEYDVWYAKKYQETKTGIWQKYQEDLAEWRKTKEVKPDEPKEIDVKNAIMVTEEYQTHTMNLAKSRHLYNVLKDSIVKPLEQRVMLIMSLNKLTSGGD